MESATVGVAWQQHVELLKMEQDSMFMNEKGISTITFYRGDVTAAEQTLRGSLKRVLVENMWISAQLRNIDGDVVAVYADEFSEAVLESVLYVAPKNALTPDMHISDMIALMSDCIVLNGHTLIETGQPVSKLALIPCADGASFALVFGMSHVISDGYTYYSILKMLSPTGTTASALTVERQHDTVDGCAAAGGIADQEWMFGMPMMCNMICGMMCAPKSYAIAYSVDDEKVSELKKKAKAASKDPAEAFVSTNDILTAHFANCTDLSLCMMAMNYRKRVEGVTEDLAGNYEGCVVFDRESCTDPMLIRQSLKSGPPFERTSRSAIPGCCSTCCSQDLGMITNWASFFSGELLLPGCEQLMHVPFADPADPCPWPIAVVFKPSKNKTAVLYFLQKHESSDLLGVDSPLGAPLGETMFAKR